MYKINHQSKFRKHLGGFNATTGLMLSSHTPFPRFRVMAYFFMITVYCGTLGLSIIKNGDSANQYEKKKASIRTHANKSVRQVTIK